MGARGGDTLLKPLIPAPAIPEIVGIAALAALAIGGDQVAFPEGLDPLSPMALTSTALNPDVLLRSVITAPLDNKASSFASAPPAKSVSLVFSGGATDGAARSLGGVLVEGNRTDEVGAGRTGP